MNVPNSQGRRFGLYVGRDNNPPPTPTSEVYNMKNKVIEFDEILGGTILSSQNIGRDMSLTIHMQTYALANSHHIEHIQDRRRKWI